MTNKEVLTPIKVTAGCAMETLRQACTLFLQEAGHDTELNLEKKKELAFMLQRAGHGAWHALRAYGLARDHLEGNEDE